MKYCEGISLLLVFTIFSLLPCMLWEVENQHCIKLLRNNYHTGENFRQFKILQNFAGINSTFHVYNFRVISHSQKMRN